MRLTTLYCDYSGSLYILQPVEKNRLDQKYPRLSALFNLSFKIWNRLVNLITRKTGWYLKCRVLTERIVYIGRR